MKHECNYNAFFLELQAAVFGINLWSIYLWGKLFMLYMDHCPMEKLWMVHTTTLNRLHEKMQDYHFEIHYSKGEENTITTT
jgi:hypothetical protein